MGYASPGVLTAAIDAGVPVISIWAQIPGQVFDFVLPANSKITHPRQLKGKTIAIHNAGWIPIVNPMLAEVGVDPKTVKYREFGPQWNQAVALKLVDAGLSWEGLRAQLNGMGAIFGSGFNFKFLIGYEVGLEAAVEQLPGSGVGSRGRGEAGHLHAVPRRLRDGVRVRPRQPPRRGPDHVRAVPGAAEADHTAGGGRLAARARHRLPRLAP